MKTMLSVAAACGVLVAPSALAASHPPLGGGGAHGVTPPAVTTTGSDASEQRAPVSDKGRSSSFTARCSIGGNAAKQVTFVVRGALSSYVAATATKPGSVTISVTDGNCLARSFTGSTLTFALGMTTRVVQRGAITDGDRGTIQVRSARGVEAGAFALLTPRIVIDRTNRR